VKLKRTTGIVTGIEAIVEKDWDGGQFQRPNHEGDRHLEYQGIAPIPEGERYGSTLRVFTVFLSPNLVVATVFVGTIAASSFIGLSLWWGIAAILLGNLLGALPASILAKTGARTGMPMLALSRLAPGVLNWLNAIAWDGLNGLFGAEALQILFHVPFWLGLVVIIAVQGLLAIFGYEVIHTFEKWMSIVLGLVFLILTIKLISHGNAHIVATTHGANAVGAFILMVTIVASFTIGYASYVADYTRYMKSDTSAWALGWRTAAGLSVSCVWLEVLGLVAASQLAVQQTSSGIYHLMGGGFLGVIAMIGIALGTVAIDAMDDYSGSVSLQSTGVKIPRPISAVIVGIGGFGVALYMHNGNALATFTNILLFGGYWVAPFAAIVIADWWWRRGQVDVSKLIHFSNLESGWMGFVALAIGFGVSVPFMNTSIYFGPIAKGPLHGGDIAYYVGFLVGGIAYLGLKASAGAIMHQAWRPTTKPLSPPISAEPLVDR
jgi:NCS1 family nucleobase:cation symporter-1